ncbi:kinase-like domain-containing protein [Radiomyces spectabilis]|uniref:kinase-like domain-containing protein n=2 Tax=Radiomyces spectabilis TaxID=64574 RepID=UPI002220D62D|nr:kinase-like domain-containing protein [Radiomyces spectabilis]KAI8371684.1 kinase-like domain-containing protein [Radiomyces spectabilis]
MDLVHKPSQDDIGRTDPCVDTADPTSTLHSPASTNIPKSREDLVREDSVDQEPSKETSSESKVMEGKSPLNKPKSMGHRRQASIGLGIITNLGSTNKRSETDAPLSPLTKNDAFFHASTIPTPRPPSLLSRSQSRTKKDRPEREEDTRQTYASRIRNLTLLGKTTADGPAPSPIPNYLNATARSPTMTNPVEPSSYDEISSTAVGRHTRSYTDDEIMPLPSPCPAGASTSTHSISTPYYIFPKGNTTASLSSPPFPVTPDEHEPSPTPSSSIPILAISPSFYPHKTNKIPSLSEVPMLGDEDDPTYDHRKHAFDIPMVREHNFRSSSPLRYNEEDLIGKQIGSFHIQRLLGVGAFSKVYLAEHIQEGGKYAIKTIHKGRILRHPRVQSSIEREIGVLKFIDHPNIVRLEATMETEHMLCIVLEYAKGGELFDFVQNMHHDLHKTHRKVDETLVKRIFLQLVKVVQWMHRHNIVHRDLKLENILIHMENDQPHLKVTDFGLARVVDPASPMLQTRCGSEEYAAPEIVQNLGYDGRLTDTWALGIILYALLVGYLPFRYNPNRGERVSQLFYRIVRADVKWPSEWTKNPSLAPSEQARHVVEQLLIPKPQKRLRIDDIEAQPWCSQS